jgi:hypothetical protein
MTPHILLISLLLFPHVCRETRSQNAEVEASAGFRVEKVPGYKGIQAFTWDDHGRVWMLSSSQNRLIVSTVPAAKPGEIQPLRSFQRLGNGRSSLLAAGNTVFVSDGEAIRSFAANAIMSDGTLHVPPASLSRRIWRFLRSPGLRSATFISSIIRPSFGNMGLAELTSGAPSGMLSPKALSLIWALI